MEVFLTLVECVSSVFFPCLRVLSVFVFFLLRVTKAKLDLLVLLAHRVPLVHAAPLETQEKMDPVAPLENQ